MALWSWCNSPRISDSKADKRLCFLSLIKAGWCEGLREVRLKHLHHLLVVGCSKDTSGITFERPKSATDPVPSGAIANILRDAFIDPKAAFKDVLTVLELRWYHPAPRPTVLLYTKSKTICLDIFSMLPSSLPCAEIIGWHALTALFMTCFMETASCIELGVCKGEFCFFALLGTGQRRCLISGRSQPGRLAVFPRFWKKKCYLNREKSFGFFFFHFFPCTFVGFQRHDPAFPHTTCHVKSKKKGKKKCWRTWDSSLISCLLNIVTTLKIQGSSWLLIHDMWCSPDAPYYVLMRQIGACDWGIMHWPGVFSENANEG